MNDWASQIFKSFEQVFREDVTENLAGGSLLSACESPIERAFGVSFMLLHGYMHGRPSISGSFFLSSGAPQMFMIPQFETGPYRVDFLIGWNIGKHMQTSIVVECDGHDFHEKTKKQAARDKSRDRALSAEFARVLRFTGSEIYADPVGCAAQAHAITDELFWAWEARKG